MTRREEYYKKWLECCILSDVSGECPADCPWHDLPDADEGEECEQHMKRTIAQYLARQLPRVLNFMDVLTSDVCWLEIRGRETVAPCTVRVTTDRSVAAIDRFGKDTMFRDICDYGEDWRCWNRKPYENERKAANWCEYAKK